MKIDQVLKEIYGGTVVRCEFNVLKGELLLEVKTPEDNRIHKITVLNISSYMSLQESGELFNREISEYYFEDVIMKKECVKTKGDKWLKQFNLEYNLAIDLFYTVILLKAEIMRVNEEEIRV